MHTLLPVSLFALSAVAFAQSTTTTITTEQRTYQTQTVRDGGLRQTEIELLRKSDPNSAAYGIYKAKKELDRVLRLNEEPVTRTETRIEIDRE